MAVAPRTDLYARAVSDRDEIAGLSFMVELSALNGRDKLDEFDIHALLTY